MSKIMSSNQYCSAGPGQCNMSKKRKEIKGKMERVKLSLFTHDMTAYIENLKESKNY